MARNKSIKQFITEFIDEYEEMQYSSEINEEAKALAEESKNKKIDEKYKIQLDKVSPFLFAESTYLLDGRPLRFRNRPYLKLPYDADIKDGLYMCGRQVEKSTTFSVQISNWTLTTPFMRSLYMAPLGEQVKVFSKDRLGRLFEYSQNDVIKKTFINTRDTQNVFNKSFSNGALIYLRHCFGTGDNIRGLSVNALFGDEVQDIDIDALPVVMETQAHALELGPGFKMTWFAGTPKTFSNTIQQLWEDSNQCEWVVRCCHCHTDQILGVKNLSPTKYICRKCGKELSRMNIVHGGRWLKMDSKKNTWGFRITQMMNPAMPPEDIWKKMNTYDASKFNNEVLGRSFENADKPFPPSLVDNMLNNDYKFLSGKTGDFMFCHTYAGLDYGTGGKSLTILYILGVTPEGKKRMIFCKAYKEGKELDREWVRQDILSYIYQYEVSYFIADYGHGFESNQKFKEILGDRFDCLYYAHNLKTKLKYENKGVLPMWVGNRTELIYDYIKQCREGVHSWCGGETEDRAVADIEILKNNHLAEQAEYKSTKPKAGSNILVTRSEELYYTHPLSQPDDGMHACLYASLAADLRPHGGSPLVFSGAYC